ncbi:MAG: prepilin peptidase [Luteitalea sp.]|nr:prepilin peptidase [Luteitalea sp.]
MTPSAQAAAVAFFALGGLAIGSFLNVCIHRLPRRQSLVLPASYCPSCEQPISWFHNVPLVGYLWLRGRCAMCQARISPRYPLVELATALLFVANFLAFGWQPLLAARLLFSSLLIILFVVDLEHRLLPNAVTLPGLLVGLILSAVMPPGWGEALLGVVLGGGVLWVIGETYERFRGEQGLGMGDVKMIAMIGAFLGWKSMLVTLVLASFAGAAVGLLLIVIRRASMQYALPFGSFLAAGAFVASLYGARLLDWYLR